ncbi:MAG: SurA N-terminal domain-containing protein [Elusimicrobia bacterium]|nr:SurA N-terminal domain-containing protein [Elusimicrobiota bacterium]
MISFLRRYRRALFVAVIAIFLIGTFVGLGGYLFTRSDTTEAVASVGSTKIPYSRFLVRVNQYADALRSRDQEVSEAEMKEIKVGMLRDMIVDELLLTEAGKMGIRVTDDELARDIRATPAFQSGGQFNPQLYFQVVRGVFKQTPQGYEETRRRAIQVGRLKQLIFQSAKLAPGELKELYAAQNKGSLKGFEKAKAEFAAKTQQTRALDLINHLLRQLSSQQEIRTYLDQRESGV